MARSAEVRLVGDKAEKWYTGIFVTVLAIGSLVVCWRCWSGVDAPLWMSSGGRRSFGFLPSRH